MTEPIYACTIRASCGASFNNSQDWFEHERNDHFHNFDLYKCEWCMNVFYTERWLKPHWFAIHASRNPRLVYHAEDMQLGPMNGERFWCGFCKSTLCTRYPGGYDRCVEEYYSHLGSHYDGTYAMAVGRMANIADWKFLPSPE
jgi:hypothetical protein